MSNGDSLSMIIIFKQWLRINSMLRDKNVIKLNKEIYRVWRGQESCVCNSVTIKYHKVFCEEINLTSWGSMGFQWTVILKLFWCRGVR